MHGWLFDAMGLPQTPQFAINIHGGKGDRASLLVDRILSLPPSVRGRLTLENDETTYTVSDLAAVSAATGVPVTFDSHHHVFNEGGLSLSDALYLAAGTWPRGIKPLQHISNTSPGLEGGSFTERRKHSDMIHYVPEPQLALLREDLIDVEVEAKWKNLSVLKMSQDFQIPIG
jgi:UV DNA damage endonuclease